MDQTQTDRVLVLAQEQAILRPRDLDQHGIPRYYLHRLWRQGLLERVGRGLYRAPDALLTEHHSLVEASQLVPQGVVCLLSALQYHGLTTQNPFEVWLAIPEKARRPQAAQLPLRIVWFSGEALTAGVEEHCLEGSAVNIYHPAKTVADCFKYRNKIGLDVAIEALRDTLQMRRTDGRQRCTVDEIWHYANVCRVANVIKPYLESLHGGV